LLAFAFQLPPRIYELLRVDAKLPCNVDQVGLMRFEETDKRREKRRLACPLAKLNCLDSGQVQDPVRPAFVDERCSKRGKRERIGVVCRCVRHRLNTPVKR
jgi:hypothetical protein